MVTPRSYNVFTSRAVGLIMCPVGGVVLYGILLGLAAGVIKSNHPGSSDSVPLILLPLPLALVLAVQWGAISSAKASTTGRSG